MADDPKAEPVKIEQKIEEVKKEAVSAGASPSQVQNVIGEIKKPDPENKEDVKAFFKEINEKLDRILAGKEPPKEELKPTEPVKNKEWYDEEIF